MDESKKKCSMCGRVLDLSQYTKNATKKLGVQSYCKDCKRKYNAALREQQKYQLDRNCEMCKWKRKTVPVPDPDPMILETCKNANHHGDPKRFKCSKCKYSGWTTKSGSGEAIIPNYCPVCGRKVIKENRLGVKQ